MTTVDATAGADHLGLHDHACWVSGPDGESAAALTRYLTVGLARHERVAFFGAPAERTSTVAAHLSGAGLPVAALAAAGQLVLRTAEDEYLSDGAFRPEERLSGYAAAVRAAVDDGFNGLRVAADVAWLPHHPAALREWAGYELRADLLAARLPFTALCVYDPRHWSPRQLALFESLHRVRVRGAPAGAGTGFRLHGQRDGSLRLRGELDLAHAAPVGEAIAAAAAHSGAPVLDVTDLEFVDVAGMRAIAVACRALAQVHGHATIRGASAAFRRLWELAEFDVDHLAVTVE